MYKKHIYTPLETATAGYKEAERIKNSTGVGISMPEIPGLIVPIDKYFARVMPWELVVVLGQPHNGKSMFLNWWERGICDQLKREARDDEVVVHVSHEESLEALSFQEHSRITGIPIEDIGSGKADLARLRWSTNIIAGINIYRIADSLQTGDDAPPLTLSNVYRMIKSLKTGEVLGKPVKIAVVFMDYLQTFPVDEEVTNSGVLSQRREQVKNDVYRMRRMLTWLEAPIICASQAKQKLDNPRPPYFIPSISDGSEAKEIAEKPDRNLGIWMPKVKDYRIGETVPELGTITEEMCYVRVNKQRGGFPSGNVFPCRWDYGKGKLFAL